MGVAWISGARASRDRASIGRLARRFEVELDVKDDERFKEGKE
jgi:hypothetical protein